LARKMEQVSSWADDVRGWHKNWSEARRSRPGVEIDDALVVVPVALRSQPAERALAREFILDLVASQSGTNNPVQQALDQQSNRHFTNLPFGTSSYPSAPIGTGPNDCVNAILRCVRVLKGNPLPGEVMNRQQAVRFLIHYVGDLHQPLHAGCGYWLPSSPTSFRARLCLPAEATSGVGDAGGNSLRLLDGDPTPDLHKLWDGEMVRNAREAHREAEDEAFSQVSTRYRHHLRGLITPAAPWGMSGSLRAAVQRWSVSSAKQSEKAYATVVTDDLEVVRTGGRLRLTGTVRLPDGYVANSRAIVNRQLARGGYRLATVLNSV
jgi:hypothetical protein